MGNAYISGRHFPRSYECRRRGNTRGGYDGHLPRSFYLHTTNNSRTVVQYGHQLNVERGVATPPSTNVHVGERLAATSERGNWEQGISTPRLMTQ
jgi:hypothetical protein